MRLPSFVLHACWRLTQNARRRTNAGAIAVVLACLILIPLAASAQEPSDPRFGLVLVPPEQPWLQRAVDAGARSNRYQLNWWDVEKSPGQFDWSIPDRDIAAIRDAGLEVTVLLHAPPAWARAPGSDWVPANLDSPDNAWATFVYQTVSRYKGQVHYYEIFNEPDLDTYWDGTPEEYARTLAVAYRAAKAADPDVQIIMAGMAHWTNPRFAEEVLNALRSLPDAERHNYFFDVAAWHWYSSSYQLYDRVLWARELLNRYGMGNKPIWINETNLPIWGDGTGPQEPARGFGTPDEQAAFIVQAFTNAFAAGADRIFVFRLNDGDMDETFGLIRNEGTSRPGYDAFRTVATWLGDSRFVTRDVRDDAIITIFRRSQGQRVTVLWNRTDQPTTVTVDALSEEGELVSVTGEQESIVATDGTYTIELPAGRRETRLDGQVVTPVGGAPSFLIEQDTTPPQIDVATLPALSSDEQVTLTWETATPSEVPIDHYEIEVRIDGGDWETWRTVTEPAITFDGEMGHRYGFRVRAVDQNDETSPWPPDEQPMAETVVGGAVVGRVANLLDEPMANRLVCADGRCARTDHAGVFRLEGLPAGEAHIRIVGWPAETTVAVDAGAERTISTLRPARDAGYLDQSEFDALGGWVVLPTSGARLRESDDGTGFAQLSAGTRLAQHLRLPADRDAIFFLRYRTNGASLDVRLRELGTDDNERRLFYDTDTLGEWREVGFDLSELAGTSGLLVLRADGDAGTLDLDTVWLGPSVGGTELFLPLVSH